MIRHSFSSVRETLFRGGQFTVALRTILYAELAFWIVPYGEWFLKVYAFIVSVCGSPFHLKTRYIPIWGDPKRFVLRQLHFFQWLQRSVMSLIKCSHCLFLRPTLCFQLSWLYQVFTMKWLMCCDYGWRDSKKRKWWPLKELLSIFISFKKWHHANQ